MHLYEFDEIGTDDAMRYWMDPEGDGTTIPGVDFGPDTITNKIKSPRLVGLWAMDHFLHNGSVDTLDELLCVGGHRPASDGHAYANHGHTYGCDLGDDQKADLAAYLLSH